jgi:CDP-diglyceride synthetase
MLQFGMSIRPSDLPELPWWGWLFGSAGAWAVCMICQSFSDRDRDWLTTFISFLAGVIAIFSGAIAVTLWFRNG